MTIPTSRDTTFIPYVVGTDTQFDKILPLTEIQEGPVPWVSGSAPAKDFSNDAHDPGGATEEGIIQNEYNRKRRQWGLTIQSDKLMSKDEERTIYFTDYWMPYCPEIPDGLDLEFFDLNVNGGESRAVKTLQLTLGIPADGMWGPQTDQAVKDLGASGNVDGAVKTYGARREAFYESLSTYRYFGADWSRRTSEVEKEAEAMDKVLDEFVADKPPSIMKDS
jgi:lysozyme family protein